MKSRGVSQNCPTRTSVESYPSGQVRGVIRRRTFVRLRLKKVLAHYELGRVKQTI